jgi:hypothetical protein
MTRVDRAALAGAVGTPWLFIWQGLDFTDQGYLLTSYRCFFEHPEATEDSGSVWLTNLVGATWDALFGALGVVGMRALWALCMSLGMLLAFRLARSLTSERAAALAVLVASIFLSNRRETWFSYNTSTSIMLCLAAVWLAAGISRHKPALLFAAGTVIGLLPFARLPNVLAVSLFAALGFAAWVDLEQRRRLRRSAVATALGVAVGVGVALLLVYLRGDGRLVFDNVEMLLSPQAKDIGYGADSLISKFINDHVRAFAWGLGVCVAACGAVFAMGRSAPTGDWLFVVSLGALGATALSRGEEPWRFVVTGTTFWVLAAVALGLWKRSVELRTASFIVLLVAITAPLGSAAGIYNGHMGLWLALPLVLSTLYTLESSWARGQGKKLAAIAALALLGEGVHRAATYTYRDARREALVESVGHPQLRAQYTTGARAKVVKEVLAALEQRVRPGDYLLASEGTPLLQYLTSTRPYLNRAWLMGAESDIVIAQLLAEAPKRTGCLPVVVLSQHSTRGAEWPVNPRPLESKRRLRRTRAAIKAFLQKYDYRTTWKNDFFTILQPRADLQTTCR